jgi:hypothetical protein
MDQFIREFEDLIQKCVSYLTEYRTWRLQLLQTEKAELSTTIEAAVQEATNCLIQGTQPANGLAQALWFLPPEQLSLISYSVTIPDLRILCETWVSYQNNLQSLYQRIKDYPVQIPEEAKEHLALNNPQEILSPPFERHLFAAVKLDTIEVHDLKSHKSIKRTLPVNFGEGGSYIQVDGQTLICLGARPPSTDVYKLDIFSFEITPLPPLRTPRCYSGVANANNFIYVFGGEEAPWKWLKSCEKYNLLDKQWLPLSNMMYPRMGFTPCPFRTLIYLPCPSTTHRIETFNPETEIFTVISVSLPSQMAYSGSVSFVAKGELCVLTRGKQIAAWRIESEREFRLLDTDRECGSSQQPLVLGSMVLIANNYSSSNTVETFNLEFYTFVS